MMRFTRILIIVVVAGILAACSGSDSGTPLTGPVSGPTPTAPAVSTLLASGGTSSSGSGGNGGSVYVESYGGAIKVLQSGNVDASFTIPSFTPDFGSNPVVVSNGTTTVLLDSDSNSGNLCSASGDSNLYTGDGNGTCGDLGDAIVTGLTVTGGATLVLVDQGFGYATLRLPNDLVINGTLTIDVNTTGGLDIEANIIDVESDGRIITSATTTDAQAGEIWLGNGTGTTKQIINRGTIEAKGLGNGSGGYVNFEPDDLVANYGTIDASGGDSTVAGSSGGSGGSSGALDVFVDYGDFYSSGAVRVNGGKGATDGGDNDADLCNITYNPYTCASIYVETVYDDNTSGRNGDIIISGTWEANGGEGVDGRGGYGGYIYLQPDALGAVTINATVSVKGGNSTGAGSYAGAYTYGIDIYSYFDPYGAGSFNDPATAAKIRVAGQYDLRGGNGDEMGGDGGYLEIYSNYNSTDVQGGAVELVGFAAINLNGGEGANGGNASNWAFELYTYSTNGTTSAGPITTEAAIEAKGGRATVAGNWGGSGGYVEMITSGTGDPSEVIDNSGSIDISGGNGEMGGDAYNAGSGDALYMEAVHLINSGNLSANGGNGVAAGGNGGNITLYSTDFAATPTTNTGTLSVAGGTPSGGAGTKTIDGTLIP